MLTRTEFLAAFPDEGPFVEFKAGVSSEQTQNTAVAFSNADGGVILIGVSDDATIRGRRLDAGTQDDIHRSLANARDIGRYAVHQVDVDGVGVIVVAVDRRREGFAQTSAGVVRVRRGTRDDPLFGSELVRFALERTPSRYETTPLAHPSSSADPALRGEVRAAYGWKRATVERLEEIELVAGEHLTVAGALFLLREPGPSVGKTHVEIRRFPDDTTIDYDRRDEITGPLQHVLPQVVANVMRELGSELVVIGSRRYDLPRIPEIVLREAIANALAHRSYEATGTPVIVELRPAAVLIRSPGGLPEPVTVDNLREANSARNRAIIAVLRRFRLAEDAGRGIDVMLDTMAEQMLDPPRFADLGHEVRVELPTRSVVAPIERAWLLELERREALQPADRLVLVHAARGELLTNSAVREILGLEDPLEARRVLTRLRSEGFLEQHGTRGGATYRLSAGLAPPAGLRLNRDELDDVIVKLAAEGPIRNANVRNATGLDRAQALAALERLVQARRLSRSGQRRGTTYALPPRV